MSTGGAGTAWRLEVHETLGSTQDVVLARARDGEPDGLAVLALRQTAGRGTQGRGWSAPTGNLNLSVLLRPTEGTVGQWGLACGVALHAAVAALLPDPASLQLKWPNDLMLDGGKMAGILVESAGGAVPEWLVAGFGANLAAAPVLAERRTACLAEVAAAPEPRVMAARLLAALAEWGAVLQLQGFAQVRAAWLAAGPAVGAPLRVAQGPSMIDGTFAGLGEDGALLLHTHAGAARIHAGELLAEAV